MWRDIKGFEGLYQVSDAGQVRNARTGHVLALKACTNGYQAVQLGRKHVKLVHRLVAAAFVDGDTGLQVNHKNGNRADNRKDNLEWVTCSENHKHSYRELERKPHAKKRAVAVGNRVYESALAAAKDIGRAPGSVISALRKGHLCKGMEVSYV